MYFILFLFHISGAQKPCPGKNCMARLLKVQPKPVKEDRVWSGGPQSGEVLVPPCPPLFSSLSSGDPSAHRPLIKVVLVMWQPPDIIFMIVIIWFLLVPGFPYMLSACFPFSWEGGLMAVGVAPLRIPPPSTLPYILPQDRTTTFPSTSNSLACRPLSQVYQAPLPSTALFLASHDPLALALFFFPQRNCESDTEEDIAKRKALHPRRRSSTS